MWNKASRRNFMSVSGIQLFINHFLFFISGVPPTTEAPEIEQQTRVPKVLQGWFENPYLVKQQPNFDAFIEASRNSAIENMRKNLKPDNISISEEPDAFFSGLMLNRLKLD